MYTVILAGGSGTRLFPLSRSSYPKQFIPLFDNESLFQKTLRRALLVSSEKEIFIVTNDEHKFLVENQLIELKIDANILTEPKGKNTLPAITYAITEILKKNSEEIVLVLPADQLIQSDINYENAIKSATKLAKTHLTTFGVVPTTPHTGYGYILPGDKIGDGYAVTTFIEKPDKKKAEEYVSKGYLWNAGMFCFSISIFIEEMKKHAPSILEAFSGDVNNAYDSTPKISIDYGLMEKTEKAAVIPLPVSWNDMGSFDAYYHVNKKDQNGNVVSGEYFSPDGENNLIISDRMVTTIGCSDMAIVDTADVLLLCPRKSSQLVGSIADALQKKGDKRASLHATVHRPWGHYTTLLKEKGFMIKKITVNPRSRISLQYHHHRSEHWVVVSGTAEVINGTESFFVRTGESTFVPSGVKHRLSNPGLIPLEVIEVQIGEYLTEDDIIRIEDDYKRK